MNLGHPDEHVAGVARADVLVVGHQVRLRDGLDALLQLLQVGLHTFHLQSNRNRIFSNRIVSSFVTLQPFSTP